MGLIKRDELDDEEKNSIIFPAWSLMKLFMTAPFSLDEMEGKLTEGKIQAEEPMKMLGELEERLQNLPDNLKGSGKKIADILTKLLFVRYDGSPKRELVREYVEMRRKKEDGNCCSECILCGYYVGFCSP